MLILRFKKQKTETSKHYQQKTKTVFQQITKQSQLTVTKKLVIARNLPASSLTSTGHVTATTCKRTTEPAKDSST